MTEENKENINDINIIENIEQKPIEAFKDKPKIILLFWKFIF